jgi:hypothetical protein
MPSTTIQVGDFVTFGGRDLDLWEVLAARHGVARVAPRSIHLAGRPARSVALCDLRQFAVVDEF